MGERALHQCCLLETAGPWVHLFYADTDLMPTMIYVPKVPSTPSGGDDGGKSFSRIGAGAAAGGDKSGNLQADASKVTSSIAVAKKADQVVVQRVEKKVMDPAKAMVILVFGIFLGMMLNESLSVNLLKMLLG